MKEAPHLPQGSREGVPGAGKDEKASCQKDTQYHTQAAWLREAGPGLPDGLHGAGYPIPRKYIRNYLTIPELYRQQKYMFDSKVHQVENRIVSISQPYLRPVVRGKAKAPVEFGAKYDVSIGKSSAFWKVAAVGWLLFLIRHAFA